MKRTLRAVGYAAVLATGTAAMALAATTNSTAPAPMTGSPAPGSQQDMSARTGAPAYSSDANGVHNTAPTVVTPNGTGNSEGNGNSSSGGGTSGSTR
ncbi:MAG TPA: hypothetical protein VFL55_02805 [Acetobacteraceae bacterium]|nr:hypothetical protein [Acetobacteraceae bacterium]